MLTRSVPITLAVVGSVLLGGCDKAKANYKRCVELEAQGNSDAAITACSAAVAVDPESESGKLASKKLDDLVPSTVTLDWCGRLRRRLDGRFLGTGQIGQDHVAAVEYFCHEAIGQPTAGLWMCHWNESPYGKDCDNQTQERRIPCPNGLPANHEYPPYCRCGNGTDDSGHYIKIDVPEDCGRNPGTRAEGSICIFECDEPVRTPGRKLLR